MRQNSRMIDWQKRFRAHMKRHGLSRRWLATMMTTAGRPITEGGIGHWLTGVRDVNLKDFFSLCEAAGADPMIILFGATIHQAMSQLVPRLLATEPDTNSHYGPFEKKLRVRKSSRRTPAGR